MNRFFPYVSGKWNPRPLKHFLERNDSGVWGTDPDTAEGTPVVRSTEIGVDGSWHLDGIAIRSLSVRERLSARLMVDDLVVVTSSGSKLHLGKSALVSSEVAEMKACFSNFVQRLTANPQGEPRYVWYLLNSIGREEMLFLSSTTTGLQNLSGGVINRVTHPGASWEEQRAIADFLDRETARIDALTSARSRMLNLLEERRVRRAASLLGDPTESVPEGWRVLPIRRLCPNVTVGVVVDPSSYFQPSGIPFIHGSDVRDGWIDESHFKFLSPHDNATLWKSRLGAGDVVAMRVGEPGRSAVVPPHLEGANCASVLIFRKSPQLASEILSAFLNSPLGKAQIASFQYGAAQGVMNVEHALQLRVPVPPARDQPRIVALLRRNESQALRSRGMLTRQVELLAEHRQALITAAVTGQMDIPSAA